MFGNVYKGKRIFVTGNTGFKGSWLILWLLELGGNVCGYSIDLPTEPNHHEILNLDFETFSGDIRDLEKLRGCIKAFQPDIVFHMAAQSLVRESYRNPVETFETNVIGTANVFDACRKAEHVKAIVNITSDKCYENQEWVWGYRENDAVGGYDPYSASKGCSELVTRCWRNSFFNLEDYGREHNILLASVRAGNVIGGGDWADDRLIPDIMRSVNKNEKVLIRNPNATRPWQHVLEPLSGYLLLGQKLLETRKEFAEAWNFGPSENGNATVGEIVDRAKMAWPKIDYEIEIIPDQPHEAGMLRLDSSKSHSILEWMPVWDAITAVEKTVIWYRAFYDFEEVQSLKNLSEYIEIAKSNNLLWTVE